VAVDKAGNVFVADTTNALLRKIAADGSVSTVAGQVGVQGFQNGQGSQAQFNFLVGLASDAQGNTYVADTANNRIRKVTSQGDVSTYAGSGDFKTVDGPADLASFGAPQGLVLDSSGNLYVADTGLDKIRKISPNGDVSTIAGDGQEGFADCNFGSCARFYQPQGIAIDSKGNLYVSDAGNQRIRKITPAGWVTTFAGSGFAGYADGLAETSMFSSPMGIVVDSKDNVYVADQNNRVIRKITQAGVVSTVAGKPGYVGNSNGLGSQATFFLPSGLAIDQNDNLYVADYSNHSVRKLVLN
jgi:sugar lactone lactonase YvrE